MVCRFLLVSLIMDAILDDVTIHERRQTLHKMTNGLGLDDAYSTTLDRIREQGENQVKLGMETLMWISCSERPLKAGELCHALAVEVGTRGLNAQRVPSTQALLRCTLGLVTIDEQSSIVRLVHSTLQEYLSAHDTLFATPHSMMAEICLTYLNFQSVSKLPTALRSIPSTMPFLHYSACHWGFHARGGVTESVKRLALRLLQQDANHISASILLREESVGFLSWGERQEGGHPDLRGYTGLHCITYMGIAEIATAMVDKKVWDLNQRDSKGATPLIWATKYGNPAIAELLLRQGDVDPTLPDKEGLAPLAHAARAGEHDVVKLLLQRGSVNPNSGDAGGRTPLSYAAGSGHEGIVKILLERGFVNSDSSDEHGRTPLSYAAESGHVDIVKILLKRRDVNSDSLDKYGRTPLSYATESGHQGVADILLGRGVVNADLSDEFGRTLLSYAAGSGLEGIVKILLERGDANPDSSDMHGATPLSYAAASGHEGVANILLGRGDVNPDSSDKYGRTPLSYAARSGHEGIVKALVERGFVNPDSSDKYGRTPLSYAARSGHAGVVKILLELADVDPDPPDEDGQTPLSQAAMFGYESVVEILLQRVDVNPDSSDRHGRTPLDYAQLLKHTGVIKPLSEQRPFIHNTPQASCLVPEVPRPSPSAQEEVESCPISQQRATIPDMGPEITEAIPLSLPDQSPLNQHEANRPASAPPLNPKSCGAPNSTIPKRSRPLKRCLTAIRRFLRSVRRKFFTPS